MASKYTSVIQELLNSGQITKTKAEEIMRNTEIHHDNGGKQRKNRREPKQNPNLPKLDYLDYLEYAKTTNGFAPPRNAKSSDPGFKPLRSEGIWGIGSKISSTEAGWKMHIFAPPRKITLGNGIDISPDKIFLSVMKAIQHTPIKFKVYCCTEDDYFLNWREIDGKFLTIYTTIIGKPKRINYNNVVNSDDIREQITWSQLLKNINTEFIKTFGIPLDTPIELPLEMGQSDFTVHPSNLIGLRYGLAGNISDRLGGYDNIAKSNKAKEELIKELTNGSGKILRTSWAGNQPIYSGFFSIKATQEPKNPSIVKARLGSKEMVINMIDKKNIPEIIQLLRDSQFLSTVSTQSETQNESIVRFLVDFYTSNVVGVYNATHREGNVRPKSELNENLQKMVREGTLTIETAMGIMQSNRRGTTVNRKKKGTTSSRTNRGTAASRKNRGPVSRRVKKVRQNCSCTISGGKK